MSVLLDSPLTFFKHFLSVSITRLGTSGNLAIARAHKINESHSTPTVVPPFGMQLQTCPTPAWSRGQCRTWCRGFYDPGNVFRLSKLGCGKKKNWKNVWKFVWQNLQLFQPSVGNFKLFIFFRGSPANNPVDATFNGFQSRLAPASGSKLDAPKFPNFHHPAQLK